ncbi:MAG TPA: hypothetical protein VN222_10995, partial [Novosphingobium sp.]|nr:hypothetical protein [Novosphingobium sp.]
LRLQLTDTLREKLGKTYSPQTASEPSRVWKNYGTFSIQASINAGDVDITRAAIAQTVAALRDHAPAEDVMLRARAPLMESFEATFKSNSGWLATIARAQGKPDSIERQLAAPQRLLRVTASEVQAAARLYLADDAAVTVIVLPRQPTPASAPAAPAQPGPGTSAQTAPGTPAATPHAEATPAQPPA